MKLLPFVACAAFLCCFSCTRNKEYDINDGLNTEITLFADEISIPIGAVGPVTLETFIPMLEKAIQSEGLIQLDEEGYLSTQSSDFMT